jgi:hypothetical protein
MPYEPIRPKYGSDTASIRFKYGIYHNYPGITFQYAENDRAMVGRFLKQGGFEKIATCFQKR